MAINSLFQSVDSSRSDWGATHLEKRGILLLLFLTSLFGLLKPVCSVRYEGFAQDSFWWDGMHCVCVCVKETDRQPWQYSILVGCLQYAWLHPSSPQLPRWPQSCHRDWWTTGAEHLCVTYAAPSGRAAMLQCSVRGCAGVGGAGNMLNKSYTISIENTQCVRCICIPIGQRVCAIFRQPHSSIIAASSPLWTNIQICKWFGVICVDLWKNQLKSRWN